MNKIQRQTLILLGILFLGINVNAQNQTGDQPAAQYILPGERNQILMEINMWGEVQRPGIYKVPSDINIIALISSAGGPTDYAKLREVKIVRGFSEESDQKVLTINLEDYLEKAEVSDLPKLYPGDTIYIPGNFRKYFSTTVGITSAITSIAAAIALIFERVSRIQ
ncbi:MAG: hypothetical protein MAGBODY4_01436 [Candidatus Marinimicrobia bacterium]|nr:hypothetical protein [Candidatus Neomarinimicrobiota bacterium]